jgi:hypothetical protein
MLPFKCFLIAGASCPDGASFLPKVAGSVWLANEGLYSLASCPPGYELATQECILCPASSYCLGGSTAPMPCLEGLYSSPGSNSSFSCRQVVFVITYLSFPVFINEFLVSEQETLLQSLALIANIPQGDVQIAGISENGFKKISVICKLATYNAVAATQQRLKLREMQMKLNSFPLQGLPEASLLSVTVTACPPGFKLLAGSGVGNLKNDGVCELCPIGYYCIGGFSQPTPCPPASFSLPGSNSSSSCRPAVFVIVLATLQLPQNNFSSSLQDKFVIALAVASGLPPERVSILTISSADDKARRQDSKNTRIQCQIAVEEAASAADVLSRLESSGLSQELKAQGLPAASLDSVTVLASGQPGGGTQQWVIALAVVGGCLVLLLIALVYLRLFHTKADNGEDPALKKAIAGIRQRLALTPSDGFRLPSERRPFWSKGQDVLLLRQSHLDAAGRLALFRDFDLLHFDAFCLSLYVDLDAGSNRRYQALGDWLLDLAEALIDPEVRPQQGPADCTTVDGRFRYFVHKVGRARIWADDDVLFQSLKAKAQLLMDSIASECDLRFKALCGEPGGGELVSVQHVMQRDSLQWVEKGHSLLHTFSSGPFSAAPQGGAAEAELVFDGSAAKPLSADAKAGHSSNSLAVVSRQDHPQVCDGGGGRENRSWPRPRDGNPSQLVSLSRACYTACSGLCDTLSWRRSTPSPFCLFDLPGRRCGQCSSPATRPSRPLLSGPKSSRTPAHRPDRTGSRGHRRGATEPCCGRRGRRCSWHSSTGGR